MKPNSQEEWTGSDIRQHFERFVADLPVGGCGVVNLRCCPGSTIGAEFRFPRSFTAFQLGNDSQIVLVDVLGNRGFPMRDSPGPAIIEAGMIYLAESLRVPAIPLELLRQRDRLGKGVPDMCSHVSDAVGVRSQSS